MGTVSRPAKQGVNAFTYEEKVAQGFLDILASEMDADFAALLADHNGNLGNENVRVGAAIARTKIDFTGANALTDAEIANVAGSKITGNLPLGSAAQWLGGLGGLYAFAPFFDTAEHILASVGPVTVRNTPAIVRLAADPILVDLSPAAVSIVMYYQRGATPVKAITFPVVGLTGGPRIVLPMPEFYDQPPAGSHTYTLRAYLSAAGGVVVSPSSGGLMTVLQLA